MRGAIQCIAVALTLGASSTWAFAQDMSTPPVLHEGLLKVSLTDFISGKYSLSYERVIGDWSSAEFTVTGIGLTTSDYTYTIAQPSTSPWDSFYPNLPADLEMEISGWEVQGAVRKYGWVDDGVPDGFYASPSPPWEAYPSLPMKRSARSTSIPTPCLPRPISSKLTTR